MDFMNAFCCEPKKPSLTDKARTVYGVPRTILRKAQKDTFVPAHHEAREEPFEGSHLWLSASRNKPKGLASAAAAASFGTKHLPLLALGASTKEVRHLISGYPTMWD